MMFMQPIGRWLLVTKNRPLAVGVAEVSAVWHGWGDGKVDADGGLWSGLFDALSEAGRGSPMLMISQDPLRKCKINFPRFSEFGSSWVNNIIPDFRPQPLCTLMNDLGAS